MAQFAGYKVKKAYISTFGSFSVFPYKDRQEPLKMRTKKERELLAFLLDAGIEGATKEQIYRALWQDSESDDIKKLIGVNLAHIKKDLAELGVENPVINNERHYSICRDEIVADIDLFEAAVNEFKLQGSSEAAQKLLLLYKGEYLSEFEAHWATRKRMKYSKVCDEAASCCNMNSTADNV
jgi:two-component SAPR family response regulator